MKFIKDLLRQWSCLQDFKTTTSDLQPLTISLVGYCTRLSEEENWIKGPSNDTNGVSFGPIINVQFADLCLQTIQLHLVQSELPTKSSKLPYEGRQQGPLQCSKVMNMNCYTIIKQG